MKISKVARKFGISKSILNHARWGIVSNIDMVDAAAGADIGDLYITELTVKQAEKIISLDNYFSVYFNPNTGSSRASECYYYLHLAENSSLIVNTILSNTKRLEKSLESGVEFSEQQRNKIARIADTLWEISTDSPR